MSVLHPSSQAILQALRFGEKTVSEIVAETGLAQSNVSNHLARLRRLNLVVPQRVGRRIYYSITDLAFVQFVRSQARRGAAEGARRRPAAEVEADYLAAARQFREDLALEVVDQALSSGFTWSEVSLKVLKPALYTVGELWAQGKLDVASEHAIAALTQRVMDRMGRPSPPPWLADQGTAVVACVQGERHCLGARMVADFLLAEGWTVYFLGADVPLADLLEFVTARKPDLVALSASMAEREPALREAARRLRRLDLTGRRPRVIAGGRLFAQKEAPSIPDLHWATHDLCAALRRLREMVRGETTPLPRGEATV